MLNCWCITWPVGFKRLTCRECLEGWLVKNTAWHYITLLHTIVLWIWLFTRWSTLCFPIFLPRSVKVCGGQPNCHFSGHTKVHLSHDFPLKPCNFLSAFLIFWGLHFPLWPTAETKHNSVSPPHPPFSHFLNVLFSFLPLQLFLPLYTGCHGVDWHISNGHR